MFIKDEYGAITICEENCKKVAEAIKEGKPFYWDINLPCHTRFETLFTPQGTCEGDRWSGCDRGFVYVSIERHGAYPLNFTHYLHPTYIMKKLRVGLPEAEDYSKIFEMIGKYL